MKTFKLLSGLALLNLLSVGIIANFTKPNYVGAVNGISTMIQIPKPTPTPIIVIKKVITKIYRTENPVLAQTVTTNQNTQTNQTVTNMPQTTQQEPTPAPAPQVAQCIITIDGSSYDVTNFRTSHSGGNIFNCGSDMSSTFWSRHGSSILSRMQQYKI